MLPLLLKTHIWESNILNRLAWCLQKCQPAPTAHRLLAFVCLLQEQCTESRNAISPGLVKKAVCAKTQGEEWWACNVCGCRWSEGRAGGIWGMLVSCSSRGLGRQNKGRVENNRTRQWYWDNLWSYLGMFNWPVSFSHLMHFHKDSSLPLALSCSSLDFPADSLSGFLCFVCASRPPPPPFQSSAELPGFVVSKQKGRFSKGAAWENLTFSSTEGEIWYGRGDCQWTRRACHLS